MAEAIHCPSCTTRYRLRPERLKPATRRAKCFSCGSVFPVEDIVRRLLAPPAEETPRISPPDPMDGVDVAPQQETAMASTPPLTLMDLEITDPGLLEKTLVAAPDSLPEAKAEAAGTYPPEITETTLSGYTSARDAIDKLFGAAPRTDLALKLHPEASPMDLEATLSAFEDTLGASNSTMSLSQADIQAALAASPAHSPAAAAPTPAEPAAPLRTSPMATEERPPAGPRPTVPRSFASLPDSPETSEEMLRLKIGEDIYTGLTMGQLIDWVEEGRILENHLVARQHSENWLEAHKVPGLRPAFERLRRERSVVAPSPDSGPGDPSPKKSLFGGLFGKN
ncbi:MAG: zinc-ribbon domain-containing protein [Geothrix sp.]|nr:zinc-ribbon domain-containing protein [Geothrix sp.]